MGIVILHLNGFDCFHVLYCGGLVARALRCFPSHNTRTDQRAGDQGDDYDESHDSDDDSFHNRHKISPYRDSSLSGASLRRNRGSHETTSTSLFQMLVQPG